MLPNLRIRVPRAVRMRVRAPFGWWHRNVTDDERRVLARGGVIDVDARDAGAAYQQILVWIGDGAGASGPGAFC